MTKLINYADLINGLNHYKATGKTFVELAKLANNITTSATIGRYASGQVAEPSFKIWQALHEAAPEFIPAPPLQRLAPIVEGNVIPGGLRRIPVFNAGAGEPSHFSDQGYPVGEAESYIYLPDDHLSSQVFAVKVCGDSMAPDINIGDTVVVDPEKRLENGQVCFATWSDDEYGQRLVKIYHQENGQIKLLSKNPLHGPIELDPEKDQGVRLCKVVGHYKKY